MKILLVEDHPIFRFGVRQLIQQRWPEAECIEACNLAEALAVVRREDLTLAVADLNLPDAEGVEVVSQLLRSAPELRLLILSLNAEAAYAQRVLELGAAGYLAKDRASAELVSALERVSTGGRYITATLAEYLVDRISGRSKALPHEDLSAQEYRVMLQLAAGKRVADIAAGMHLSPKTVSTYRSRVLDKLAIASNAELARYCLTLGLTDDSL
jgi:two-component system, NarL family, invasion response regulator UvrY